MDISAAHCTLPHAGGSVRVAQLTDMHLGEHAGDRLAGMDTDASLAHVVALLRDEPRPPDLVLATGDLASNASAPAYGRARAVLEGLSHPWFWLPGNHDDIHAMRTSLNDGAPMIRGVRIGNWQIILLDSTIPGRVGGRLGDAELQGLEQLLRDAPDAYVLVCLHHQPVPVGCAWLDEQKVANGAQLLALLERHPRVRGVLWGHVHQEFQRRLGNLTLMATPSTCIQFAAHSDGFRLADLAPGMRWLDLHPDGHIDTRVERVRGVTLEFDRNSSGYE